MYIPTAFEETDPSVLHDLIRRFSFATLVTATGDAPFATHLPLTLEIGGDGASARLLGHVARANPHWRCFDGDSEAMAVFQGPHAYVSPNWYTSPNMVPTWNYAAVHVYGRPRILQDPEQVVGVLAQLTADNETEATGNWSLDRLDAALVDAMCKSIVAFELPIARLQGKFKLSQNRKPEDVAGAAAGLDGMEDPTSRAVSELMLARLAQP